LKVQDFPDFQCILGRKIRQTSVNGGHFVFLSRKGRLQVKVTYPDFDQFLEGWKEPVYHFCQLLVQVPQDAQDAVFQTFLYLGALPQALAPEEERWQVFRWAYVSCEDYYYRKARRPIKRAELEKALGRALEEPLWKLLRRPLREKAAFYLLECQRCAPEEAGRALTVSPARVQALSRRAAPEGGEALAGQLAALTPDEGWLEGLSDEVHMRFHERSVGFENGYRRFRLGFAKAAPWLALAAALFCAAAVWYTSTLPPWPEL